MTFTSIRQKHKNKTKRKKKQIGVEVNDRILSSQYYKWYKALLSEGTKPNVVWKGKPWIKILQSINHLSINVLITDK